MSEHASNGDAAKLHRVLGVETFYAVVEHVRHGSAVPHLSLIVDATYKLNLLCCAFPSRLQSVQQQPPEF